MTFGIVSALAALVVLIALNWRRLNAMGPGKVAQMLGIWTIIILAIVLAVRFLGFA